MKRPDNARVLPNGREWTVLMLLGLLYFALRLPNLMILPIFYDEAHYTLSAVLIGDAPLRTDPFVEVAYWGVPPLFTWLAAPLTRLISDPLLAARLASTIIGLAGLAGVWFCGKSLGGRATAMVAATLFAISPFMVMYQRMALVDGLLATVGAFALLATISLARSPARRTALWLGVCMTMAVLTKITGPMVLLLPVIAVWAAPRDRRRQVYRLSLLAIAMGLMMAAILLIIPEGASLVAVTQQQQRFSAPFIERTLTQGSIIAQALWLYLMPPVLVLTVLGLRRVRHEPGTRVLAAWAILSTAPFMLVHLNLNPRYLLPGMVPLILLAARGAVESYRSMAVGRGRPWKLGTVAALLLVLVTNGSADERLLTDPAHAALPAADRAQYITGWPSGYAVTEALRAAKRLAHGRVFTLMSSIQNPPGDELMVLAGRDPQVHLAFGDLSRLTKPAMLAGHPGVMYVIATRPQGQRLDARRAGLRLLLHVPNGDGNGGVDLYRPIG